MKTIISDIDIKNSNDKYIIINANKCTKECKGCFSCWTKTPTTCAIKDEYQNLSSYLLKSDELIIVTKNRYGCYDANVKRILERCIGYVEPFFTIREKMIHHKTRTNKKLNLTIYIYGNKTQNDIKCFEQLLKANAINLNAKLVKINYINDIKEITNCIL